MTSLKKIHKEIISCSQCPRLRDYCKKVALEKRRAYIDESYWGKPVPGLGTPQNSKSTPEQARLCVIGLAPAAQGANRTGRIFTGDRSGDWLYRALYQHGFANQPYSRQIGDGLELIDTYISCIVKCAPPGNKPNPDEKNRCIQFLERELSALNNVHVFVALGKYAYDGLWSLLKKNLAELPNRKPKFAHGLKIDINQRQTLLLSYHPSQQNTFTGKLTEEMFDHIFKSAKNYLGIHK